MSSRKSSRTSEVTLKVNRHNLQENAINILLLGQSGVGKTTFINAFANYLVYDKIEEAKNEEMQVVIPSSFSHTDDSTFKQMLIAIGKEESGEKANEYGQSDTQQCRSFVFPIGDRVLRFIDTPGVGDTKGVDQDEKNFQDILNYISQFEHLKAVFILLKPNEERLTILFRYCINELLRHLDKNAVDNIIFVFTYSRATFFKPGSTNTLLQSLIREHHEKSGVHIPYSTEETFMFDSESFRFLALHKNGVRLNNEMTKSYTDSWDRSITECSRLMKHVMTRSFYAISNVVSLNEAEQLVRKLPRPIAETARLIEENIQLAQEHKRQVLEGNPGVVSRGIPQKAAVVEPLRYPQTVCTNEKCLKITGEGANKKVKYATICHDQCYVKGVEQEKIAHEWIRECHVMDPRRGFCTVCGCLWDMHMHTTYKCDTNLTHTKAGTASHTTANKQLSLAEIDKLIKDLRQEQEIIQDTYKKLARFLHVNSLLPINNDYIEYLQYYIREEKMKRTNATGNTEVITNLEKMLADYTKEMEAYKKIVQEQGKKNQQAKEVTPQEVFDLRRVLFKLPINGKLIRDQVDGIKMAQERSTNSREKLIELPGRAANSKVMLRLKNVEPKDDDKETNS